MTTPPGLDRRDHVTRFEPGCFCCRAGDDFGYQDALLDTKIGGELIAEG